MRQDIRFTNSRVRLNTDNLDKIQKQLKKQFFCKVGVLGGRSPRDNPHEKGPGPSNADLGFIHEFGSPLKNIPARSWLRMPLMLKLPDVFKKIGQRLLNRMTAENVRTIFSELGARAENVVQSAFQSAGFGYWAPNKLPYAKLRKVKKGKIKMSAYKKMSTEKKKLYSKPLIDTGELRKSIDSEVKER